MSFTQPPGRVNSGRPTSYTGFTSRPDPFIDSSGLRAVLEIARRLADDAASLVLLSPVGRLLSLAGLDERIPVVTSLQQADALLTAPGRTG